MNDFVFCEFRESVLCLCLTRGAFFAVHTPNADVSAKHRFRQKTKNSNGFYGRLVFGLRLLVVRLCTVNSSQNAEILRTADVRRHVWKSLLNFAEKCVKKKMK